jgi:hypothetical protein
MARDFTRPLPDASRLAPSDSIVKEPARVAINAARPDRARTNTRKNPPKTGSFLLFPFPLSTINSQLTTNQGFLLPTDDQRR